MLVAVTRYTPRMKLTKLGHCCLLIEERGVRLMTDPGIFTRELHEGERDLDAVLITHEHADHFHTGSLQALLSGNPGMRVICNTGVGRILSSEGIRHEVLEDGQSTDVGGVGISAAGRVHATIHPTLSSVDNTGFLIAGRLWYPGDALTLIEGRPSILALPIAGPWMKVAEAVDFALAQKPELCIPVHDHVLSDAGRSTHETLCKNILGTGGVTFLPLELSREYEL